MRTAFMQGNAACAEGALAAGCRFFCWLSYHPFLRDS